MIRYRRNINCLSSDRLHDLREALLALYDTPEAAADSFATLGGLHGLPAPSWCDHGAPGFLTWHRAYMRAFERALQTVRCDVSLPFWDWSSRDTTGVPAACREATYVNRDGDTVANPLFSGPIAASAGGGATSRRPDIDTTTFGDIGAAARAAAAQTGFTGFQSALNGPHGSIHGRVGGEMATVARAGFDPLFFLHHCNVDRLWWNWQRTHPWVSLPAAEAAHELDPFPQPFAAEWSTGADVEEADDLGYRYLNWCFRLPPIIVWEVQKLHIESVALRHLRDARLVVRAHQMPADSVEFRVFLGDPKHVEEDAGERNPAFAGSIGLFGMGDMHMNHDVVRGNFDVALDLTEHLRACASRSAHEHTTEHHSAGKNDDETTLAIRVAAFDTNGERVDATRLPADGIDLEIT